MARGVAYGTNTPAHVLNVPAGRMSAFPDDEDSFLRFARERDQTVTGGSFVSRSAYGEYLDRILAEAEENAPAQATLERIVGHVADIDVPTGDRRVSFCDTRRRTAHQRRPCRPSTRQLRSSRSTGADRSFYSSAPYIRDPWAPGALDSIVPEDSILLIGTGLTMYDIALELRRARGASTDLRNLTPRVAGAAASRARSAANVREFSS
jgi:uncharacterized NAD(P)/FAD-binding protein YdhS